MAIGILTSGGDAPGMNAAVRGFFRALKLQEPRREVVFFRDGYKGLAGKLDSSTDRNVDRTAIRDILHRGGTFLGTGRVRALIPPPDDAPDRDARLRAQQDFLRVAAVNLYQLDISDLIVVGGDGSFKGARLIADHFRDTFPERPFRVLGIPATIDNDIHGTAWTIGFDTALNNTVSAIRNIRDTVESHKRGIILEVMGNRSGWLALQSAVAGGASVVAIPEIPASWDHDDILRRIRAGIQRDYRYFIVVVAEGVRTRAGRDWSRQLRHRMENDEEIIRQLGDPMEVRINSVGHVARGGHPSALDNTLASAFGAEAASRILSSPASTAGGAQDSMIGHDGARTVHVPLDEVTARSPRLVSPDAAIWQLAQQLMLNVGQPY
ncbi:MAG: ATP-dependent 6-phosphofructokinase [Deltaproteobacteria bacterium]|nr:MAG: ATP-dependent 6-phosphofructokinase [Deltaproteobacteria bacterium]